MHNRSRLGPASAGKSVPNVRILAQVVAILAISFSFYLSYRISSHFSVEDGPGLRVSDANKGIVIPPNLKISPRPHVEDREIYPPPHQQEAASSEGPSDWTSKIPIQGDPLRQPSLPSSPPTLQAEPATSVQPVQQNVPDDKPVLSSTFVPAVVVNGPEDPFFGSSADLEHHKKDALCWDHFDFGMLDAWDAKAQVFCVPPSIHMSDQLIATPQRGKSLLQALQKHSEDESWLVCRVTVDLHLPPATAPHTICDGTNIVFDFGKMRSSTCLVHRPGYKCDGDPVFYNYDGGALQGACHRHPNFLNSAFPRDHLMDIFSSFQGGMPAKEMLSVDSSDAPVTLFVTRERAEHANPFHATTDLINAFYILHLTGVIDGLKGDRAGMENVQVMLLDEQTGPFETVFWQKVFSPRYPLLRPSILRQNGRQKLRFHRALFVPPGYSNLLLAHVLTDSDCHAGTQLLQSYRRFFLSGLELHDSINPSRPGPQVGVTLVSRRPYTRHGIDHKFMGRQIDNEDELLAIMNSFGSRVNVTRVDLALIDTLDQIHLIADTEILVAMHGAALTYPLYMPTHGAVIEFWPKAFDIWRCFEHIATMAGLIYERWANPDPARFRTDTNGDYTRVDGEAFRAMFSQVLRSVEERRANLLLRH